MSRARVIAMARRQARRVAAAAIVVCLFLLARLPSASSATRAALAARFHFAVVRLPEPQGSNHSPERRTVRPVHPSLARISAWISSVGAAVALADLDGDGLANDVCWVDPRTDQVLVAPAPGTGDRYPAFALDAGRRFDRRTMAPMGCLPGHFGERAEPDVVVYYWGRRPLLFQHEGDALERGWQASELVPPGGPEGSDRWFTNAALTADIDGDGRPDLLFGNYFPDGARILDAHAGGRESMQASMSRADNGGDKHLLLALGRGDGEAPRFREASDALPPEARHGWTLALGAADLDGDLLPELYIANDFGSDRLLHNRSRAGAPQLALLDGEGGFAVPGSKRLGHDSYKGMGVDFGDLNGDGWPDLFVSNIAAEYALEESHFAWISTGQVERMRSGVAPYVERSEALGLSRSSWSWEARLADFDNDGGLEALQAIGFVRGSVDRWPELQELAMGNDGMLPRPTSWPRFQPGDDLSGGGHNRFYVRAGGERFVDVGGELGMDEPAVSRGIAIADIDGDGALDFAVVNQWGPSTLHRNMGAGGAFLGLHLMLPLAPDGGGVHERAGHPRRGDGTRPAIGAQARVTLPSGALLTRAVDGGSGHSGKSAPELHFGLGKLDRARAVPVALRWRDPDGVVRAAALTLAPGWHTITLGWAERKGAP